MLQLTYVLREYVYEKHKKPLTLDGTEPTLGYVPHMFVSLFFLCLFSEFSWNFHHFVFAQICYAIACYHYRTQNNRREICQNKKQRQRDNIRESKPSRITVCGSCHILSCHILSHVVK